MISSVRGEFLQHARGRGPDSMNTKATHTPGPWSAVREEFRDYVGHTIECDDFVLAETITADASDVTNEEAANARLIAAAPALLAAAEAIFELEISHSVECATSRYPSLDIDSCNCEIAALRAAIQQAKGGRA